MKNKEIEELKLRKTKLEESDLVTDMYKNIKKRANEIDNKFINDDYYLYSDVNKDKKELKQKIFDSYQLLNLNEVPKIYSFESLNLINKPAANPGWKKIDVDRGDGVKKIHRVRQWA